MKISIYFGNNLARKMYIIFLVILPLVMPLPACKQTASIPDFGAIKDVKEKKRRFFEFMRPIIEAENARVLEQRKQLFRLYEKRNRKSILSKKEMEWLDGLLAEYKVNRIANEKDYSWKTLFRRVDIVPVKLALAQAANESAWGTSRFARLGNNMYGQWCFTQKCGIIPNRRVPGATHEVVKFKSIKDSVRSYMRNLNTNGAFSSFRRLRYEQRQAGKHPDSYTLASGLTLYSERREEYINNIRAMIESNRQFMGL